MAKYDLIIQNGTIIDGVENEPHQADIGIKNDEIVEIADLTDETAELVISADGRFVTPGFIDVQNHADSYFTLLETPGQQSMIKQGITTVSIGNCGTSLAPLASMGALQTIRQWKSLAGANINWETFGEFMDILSKYPLGVNVMSMIGYSTIRRGVVGDQLRPATPSEIAIMQKLIQKSFDEGAGGASLGLVYSHETIASADELRMVASETARAGRMLSVHMRSESAHVVTALAEVIKLAEDTNVSLRISHLKIRGRKNWMFIDELLGLIDQAYQRGINISFDIYPDATSWSVLYTYLPKWAYEGGRAQIAKNLADPKARSRMVSYLKAQEMDLGAVQIATSDTNPALVGRVLSQVAENQQISVEEALLNVVEATDSQVLVFDYNISQDIMEQLLKHPLSIIATDGAGYDFGYHFNQGLVHPRCFGAMPKFLQMVRDRKLMKWSEAIKKITSRPAEKLGLTDRGKIKKGFKADLVVFDPRVVGSRANFQNPYVEPDGIDYVVNNGVLVHSLNGVEHLAGKVLKI